MALDGLLPGRFFFRGPAVPAIILAGIFLFSIMPPAYSADVRSELDALKLTTYEHQKEIRELQRQAASGEALKAIRQSQADLLERLTRMENELNYFRGSQEQRAFQVDGSLKKNSSMADENRLTIMRLSDKTEQLQQRILRLETAFNSLLAELKTAGVEPKPTPPAQDTTTAPPTDSAAATGAGAIGNAPASAPALPAPAITNTAAAAAPADNPVTVYESLYELFKEGETLKAREGFFKFLKDYPDHPLAGNARYWLGETYYAEEDYEQAILKYEDVIRKHKENRKVPAALLKQAFSFEKLNDNRAATGILKEIIERYPDSDSAELAKKKLQGLARD